MLNESSATVAEAAHALGVEPASIAKTLSVLQGEKPVLIVTEGTAKLDNHKYKSLFHIKAKMIPYDEVEAYVGHAPGGVCPFGVNEGVAVYLDESLRKFDTVYPAADACPADLCVVGKLLTAPAFCMQKLFCGGKAWYTEGGTIGSYGRKAQWRNGHIRPAAERFTIG